MAKQGMKRGEDRRDKKVGEAKNVPELQGRAKLSNEKARPIIAGTSAPSLKVYHSKPHRDTKDKPIPDVYPEIDTDLARDNIENDLTFADRQDLNQTHRL